MFATVHGSTGRAVDCTRNGCKAPAFAWEGQEDDMSYEYKDPRQIEMPAERRKRADETFHRAKRHTRRIFVRVMEILLIALSYFERSYIVRFLSAKISMDVIVEVTARFGRDPGHRPSTVMAVIVAEPRLIAVIVTGIILVLELIVLICRHLFCRHRRSRP